MKHLFLIVLTCLLIQPVAWSQESKIIVKGSVVDAGTQTPIPGVFIVEQGTDNGVVTDFDGNFTIEVPGNASLEASYMGYATQTVAVNNQTELFINLKVSTNSLDEVVIVGYSTQQKGKLTAAVSTIEGEDLEEVSTPNVSGMLQGKAAGVQVVNSSGQPGALPDIHIRGISSLNGSTSPLWVVDGVIVHGTPNIDPNNVKSISVLKDASATALYGSRGANGVVVVTTKTGKVGETVVNVSARTGFSNFNMGNFEVMNSQELYNYYQKFSNPDRIPAGITEDVLNTDFDWVKNGTQTGQLQDYNVSLSGGTEKSRTYLSLGYFDATGTLKGFDYNRMSMRLNLEYDVTDKLTVKPKVGVNYTTRKNRQHDLYSMFTNMPWDNPYAEDGSVVNPQETGVQWFGRDKSNYLYDLQWNHSKTNTLNLFTNMDLVYDITPNLKFISTNSYTLYYSRAKSYTDPRSNGGKAIDGALEESNAQRITRFTNQMLRYTNKFGDNQAHEISALAAYEYNDYVYESMGTRGIGLIAGSEILDVTATPDKAYGTKNDYALQSFLTNVDYSYDDRYMGQISLRYDGASNFGENNKYGVFYSFSGGWNIHNESFFKSNIFDQLKLRASYGAVGNRPSSLYPQYALYDIKNTYTGLPAATPSQLGNPDLGWEKSYQTNLAVDAIVFDRFNVTLEYYNKNTSDLLYFVTLPSVTGYTGYWENIGGVKNTGVELAVGADIFKPESDFQWNLNVNIGSNQNEVTDLYEGQEVTRGYKITQIGEDFNTWYMRKWLGVDPENGNPLWEAVDPNTGERTATSDYNEATKQKVGTSSPDFYGGINSAMTYKGFSLNMSFSFVSGGEILNLSRQLYDADGTYPTYNQQKLADGWNRWEKPGDIATHPKLVYGGNNNSNKPSSRYLEDGSYFRLRNIKLGYSFSDKVTESLKINRLSVYFTADNVFTLTDFSGTDPEVGVGGIYNNLYPIPRRFAIGVNLSL